MTRGGKMSKFLYFFLGLLQLTYGLKELKSNEELERFLKNDGPRAVFYFHKENLQDELKSKMRDIMEGANENMHSYDNFFIKLAMINCKGESVDTNTIDECKGIRRAFYAYKGDKKERFSMQTLYDLEAFLGHMLYFSHDEEIGIVQSQDDFNYEQEQARGNKDIILMYFLGLGTKDQYHFMNFASKHLDQYKFVYSTEREFAEKLGMPAKHGAALWYVACSEIKASSTEQCQIKKHPSESIDTTGIASFVSVWNAPLVDEMQDGGKIPYKDIHLFYLFYNTDETKTELVPEMETAINSLGTSNVHVRCVLVDTRKHLSSLSGYGIYENTQLPVLLLEIENGRHSNEREFESFTTDEDMISENIAQFAYNYLQEEKSADAFTNAAHVYNIDEIKFTSWEEHKDPNRKVLAAGCSPLARLVHARDLELKNLCDRFNVYFRHLVRTFFENDVIDVDFVYVDYSNSKQKNNVPFMYYKQPDSAEENLKLKQEEFDYNTMLEWANKVMNTNVRPLPLSGSDFVPLPASSGVQENFEAVDMDQHASAMEDDEVAKDALQSRNEEFYKDDVPELTDATFEKSVKDTDGLLVVFMHVPWDNKCYLFSPVFASIREKLGSDSPGSTLKTNLMKIDCYEQYQACMDQKVIQYPVVRFFLNGKFLSDYAGMLDEKSLTKTIRLYQNPALIKINQHDISAYKQGRHPMPASAYVPVSLLATFSSEENQDFLTYKSFAENHRGEVLFGYTLNEEITKSTLESFTRENDDTFTQQFSKDFNNVENLQEFLRLAVSPPFGELSAANLLAYKAHGKSLLILFTKPEERVAALESKVLKTVFETLKPDVIPVWMNTDIQTTKNIRRNYVGKIKRDVDIVVSDHEKGQVYAFSPNQVLKTADELQKSLSLWLQNYTQGKLKVTSHLNRPLWKPLREGFDFLKYIDVGVPQSDDEYHTEYKEESVDTPSDGDYQQPDTTYKFHGHKIHGHTPDVYNMEDLSLSDDESDFSGSGGEAPTVPSGKIEL